MNHSWILGLLLAALPSLVAQDPQTPPTDPAAVRLGLVRASIGVEGQFLLRHATAGLRARPLAERSPILLRIAEVGRDGDGLLYDVRFIGEVAGEFDLRDWLQRVDGGPLQAVEPMRVEIVSSLAVDHDGQLHQLPAPAPPAVGGYRALLWGFAILWSLPLLWWVGRRVIRRAPAGAAVTSAGPTLADQLRPLVAAALQGAMSVRQRAQLEILLLGFWRYRLGLNDLGAQAALAEMRQHGDGGRLLRALEDWLHRPPGSGPVDLEDLLQPYAEVAALDLPAELEVSLGKPLPGAVEEVETGEGQA